MKTERINTRGLTFGALFKLNILCFPALFAVIFILFIIPNFFMPSSVSPTTDGFKFTGLSAIGMLIVSYPVFVFGFSLALSVFMLIGQKIYTKFKDIELTYISID